jgi:hypothetical protein
VRDDGLLNTLRRSPLRSEEIDWLEAYDRRMRRFNLTVILIAAIAVLAATVLVFG